MMKDENRVNGQQEYCKKKKFKYESFAIDFGL